MKLLVAATVRIEEAHAIPDWRTGEVRIRVQLRSTMDKPVVGKVRIVVAPAVSGESVAEDGCEREISAGETRLEMKMRVPHLRLWESNEGRVLRRAVESLPLLRDLDESRMVLLISGRPDGDGSIGSWSSSGSRVWEKTLLEDLHSYPSFLHSANTMREMRTHGGGPVLLSEYGVCGAMDFARYGRNFEQLGLEHTADARIYQAELSWFLSEWKKLHLQECWAQPEDYFHASQRTQAKLALNDYNTWMSNPNLVGDFTSTQIVDVWYHGCGITNYFREPKPGMLEAFQDMASRVRLCLFVEPINVYRGTKGRLEAVLMNRDALKPGKYPVRIQVLGPDRESLLDKEIAVEIPEPGDQADPPCAHLAFDENLVVDTSTSSLTRCGDISTINTWSQHPT